MLGDAPGGQSERSVRNAAHHSHHLLPSPRRRSHPHRSGFVPRRPEPRTVPAVRSRCPARPASLGEGGDMLALIAFLLFLLVLGNDKARLALVLCLAMGWAVIRRLLPIIAWLAVLAAIFFAKPLLGDAAGGVAGLLAMVGMVIWGVLTARPIPLEERIPDVIDPFALQKIESEHHD